MRLKQRSTVLLPQPDGPISAVIFRGCDVQVDARDGLEAAVEDVEVRAHAARIARAARNLWLWRAPCAPK